MNNGILICNISSVYSQVRTDTKFFISKPELDYLSMVPHLTDADIITPSFSGSLLWQVFPHKAEIISYGNHWPDEYKVNLCG